MFPLGSTPSKRPKRRVESYRILYAHILHALSLPGHPLRVTEKATHGEQVGLYSLHSRMGTSITVNIVPKCEVCPRDHGKVVESLQGGSIVVELLFMHLPSFVGVLCWSLFCYSLLCVLSSFAITLMRKRELVAVIAFWISCYCKSFMALPRGAEGWSAVCDCGIS